MWACFFGFGLGMVCRFRRGGDFVSWVCWFRCGLVGLLGFWVLVGSVFGEFVVCG